MERHDDEEERKAKIEKQAFKPNYNFSKKAIYVILECSECFETHRNKYAVNSLWLDGHTAHLTYNTVQYIHNMFIIIILSWQNNL